MTPEDIDKTIAALMSDEEILEAAIKAAEVRLSRVRAARAAFALLASPEAEPGEFLGKMADGCRTVLKQSAGSSLSPLEVRDRLKVLGYDLSTHKNPMASIHSVLKRLAEPQDEIKSKTAKDGTRYYAVADPKETAYAKAMSPTNVRTMGDLLRDINSAINSSGAKAAMAQLNSPEMRQTIETMRVEAGKINEMARPSSETMGDLVRKTTLLK